MVRGDKLLYQYGPGATFDWVVTTNAASTADVIRRQMLDPVFYVPRRWSARILPRRHRRAARLAARVSDP